MEDVQSSMLQKWDEVLINAWGRNPSVYPLAIKFLEESGISFSSEQDKHSTAVLVEKFAELGVHDRSPKTHHQFCMNVKDFFKGFFRKAHTLLLQNKKEEALAEVYLCKIFDLGGDFERGNRSIPLPNRIASTQQTIAE